MPDGSNAQVSTLFENAEFFAAVESQIDGHGGKSYSPFLEKLCGYSNKTVLLRPSRHGQRTCGYPAARRSGHAAQGVSVSGISAIRVETSALSPPVYDHAECLPNLADW
jgi:hypothetical protein